MKSTTAVLCARLIVWLMVAGALVAVLRGAPWWWMLGALGMALAADVRDLIQWPARA